MHHILPRGKKNLTICVRFNLKKQTKKHKNFKIQMK